MVRAQEGLPRGLLPFMVVEEPSWPDVYAFDVSSAPPTIVVWSDHAVVQRWGSFEAFLQWVRAWTSDKQNEKGA
jgi:hypothetical protein